MLSCTLKEPVPSALLLNDQLLKKREAWTTRAAIGHPWSHGCMCLIPQLITISSITRTDTGNGHDSGALCDMECHLPYGKKTCTG